MATRNLTIRKGATWTDVIRVATSEKFFAEITSVTLSSPLVITCAAGHGLAQGWPVRIHCISGLQPNEFALPDDAIDPARFYPTTYIDNQNFSIPLSGKCLTPYVAGGVVEYLAPNVIDVGQTARMQIREDVDATTPIIELTTANGRIALDVALSTITRSLSALDTAALPGDGGVYDLELVSGATVMRIDEGKVRFLPEVTR